VSLLLLFTAGNLLPAQLVFIPVFKMYITFGKAIGMPRILYDSPWGVVLIHVAFQMGFATFVLSSYMKTVPKEISESAMVDGASVFTHYTKVMLPLLRPALASLGVLISTGYQSLLIYPHMVIFPVLVLSILMLSFNLVADGLRDAFDPKMKGF
jgi:multiple sugar transport system permease protein